MPSTTTAFLGEIMLVPYNFAPRGWAFCQGQTLSIAQNTALFSLLGTTYGGNGTTTFALPDLRGRCAVSSGQAPGLSNYTLGEQTGTESATLTVNQMPAHSHIVNAVDDDATSSLPDGHSLATITPAGYASIAPNTTMDPRMIQPAGGSQPFEIIQPLLVLNYCIALTGIYPSRN
jgi:microcystin-dependent protein